MENKSDKSAKKGTKLMGFAVREKVQKSPDEMIPPVQRKTIKQLAESNEGPPEKPEEIIKSEQPEPKQELNEDKLEDKQISSPTATHVSGDLQTPFIDFFKQSLTHSDKTSTANIEAKTLALLKTIAGQNNCTVISLLNNILTDWKTNHSKDINKVIKSIM